MPLSHKTTLSAFDAETQIMLSTIYVKLSAAANARLDGQADDARNKIADELLRLAFLGERDPTILERQALAACGHPELGSRSDETGRA